ncbi:hypothetical protein TNCV_1316581 [Trichonephila clavipes]|nr:hypothetical protein TNCV_1316581 [Trichonephila clavipes]
MSSVSYPKEDKGNKRFPLDRELQEMFYVSPECSYYKLKQTLVIRTISSLFSEEVGLLKLTIPSLTFHSFGIITSHHLGFPVTQQQPLLVMIEESRQTALVRSNPISNLVPLWSYAF